MFATIRTIKEPEAFWAKLKYNLLPPPVTAQRIHVEEGSDFLRLDVPIIRGKIYWSHVRQAAGEAYRTMLAPVEMRSAYERVELLPFRAEEFRARLTVNSFLQLVRLLPQKHLLSECTVTDIAGSLAPLLKSFPQYCRSLKIITANAQRYADFSRYAMENFGCALCVSSDITKAFRSSVVLVPKPLMHPTAFSANSLVFAAWSDNIYTSRLLLPEGVNLPHRYLKMMPKGISPSEFAGALYEISGVSSLGNCACPAFKMHNSLLGYKDVLKMLDY